MACCASSSQDPAARARTRLIDTLLKKEENSNKSEMKLLLLGAGESGKSTVIKQMRILHGAGYSDGDRREIVPLIHQNLITAMKAMLDAMVVMGLSLHNPALQEPAAKFLADLRDLLEVAPVAVFKGLWADAGLQAAYARRREYQLNDSTAYFMDALGRIEAKGFTPTEQDVLRVRIQTSGVVEYTFNLPSVIFQMVDVGGQRSQRRKWVHCFEKVTALIFVAAISEYDQFLAESPTTNRMTETITLFKHITREPFFIASSVILFLNKVDLLAGKVATSALTTYFPDFKGTSSDAEQVKAYFLDIFAKNCKQSMYPHFTCATDTTAMKAIIHNVQKALVEAAMSEFGLL